MTSNRPGTRSVVRRTPSKTARVASLTLKGVGWGSLGLVAIVGIFLLIVVLTALFAVPMAWVGMLIYGAVASHVGWPTAGFGLVWLIVVGLSLVRSLLFGSASSNS